MSRPKKYDRDGALERAMHAFWLRGYSATSINDLVDETGLNRFSLYKEFESKEKLYTESFRQYECTVMESRMTALEQSNDGLPCLRSFFTDYIKGVKEGLRSGEAVSCLTVLNATEKIGREEDAFRTMNRILARMVKAFETTLERAMEQNEIAEKTDFREDALLLVGCTYGLDILSKFLPVKELEAYVNRVIESLK